MVDVREKSFPSAAGVAPSDKMGPVSESESWFADKDSPAATAGLSSPLQDFVDCRLT